MLRFRLQNDTTVARRCRAAVCKEHCDRFSGEYRSDCNDCCERTVNGSQKRCDFGCGTIRTKKKRKRK